MHINALNFIKSVSRKLNFCVHTFPLYVSVRFVESGNHYFEQLRTSSTHKYEVLYVLPDRIEMVFKACEIVALWRPPMRTICGSNFLHVRVVSYRENGPEKDGTLSIQNGFHMRPLFLGCLKPSGCLSMFVKPTLQTTSGINRSSLNGYGTNGSPARAVGNKISTIQTKPVFLIFLSQIPYLRTVSIHRVSNQSKASPLVRRKSLKNYAIERL